MIVFEDDSLLVWEKPAGCTSELSQIRRHLTRPGELYLVHRLDKETSGLLILAKSAPVQHALEELFFRREVEKLYLAYVAGTLAEKEGRINLPLLKTERGGTGAFVIVSPRGSPAVTYFRVEKQLKGKALLLLQPITGRTHQIRVHLATRGHPVLGDALYGDKASAPRLLLHAHKLRFRHPVTGQRLELTSQPPEDFKLS